MKVIRDRPKSVALEEFLTRPLFGFFATASESGPRVSPVWFLWEDDAIWIIGNKRTDTFPSRVDSEPRCAIAFVDFDAASGLVHHVGMRGRATVETWNRRRASRILGRYLGSNETHWDRERFEGVDGSSPSEGFAKAPPIAAFSVEAARSKASEMGAFAGRLV